MSGSPRFSIITPCLNRAAFIDAAIESVRLQDDASVEHLIIDGGSTDGTLDAVAKHPHLRVISERDGGMYDALNKGLALAQGEVIGFLNSDDEYPPGTFAAVRAALADGDFLAVAGAARFFNVDERGVRRDIYSSTPDEAPLLERSILGSPSFNAWFFRREVFARVGVFDARFRIAGDREFMMRFALAQPAHVATARVLYHYRQHPGSLTIGGAGTRDRILAEHLAIAGDYLTRAGVPDAARALFRQWSSHETLDGAARSLSRRRWTEALRFARAGMRFDAAWPLQFVRRLTAALVRRASGTPTPASQSRPS
jgi:glycosyltransferase involved in cell wall biosynthesis